MLRLLLACISSKLQVEGFCVKRNPKSRSSVHQELSLLFCCQVICTDPFLPFTKDLGVLESRKAELLHLEAQVLSYAFWTLGLCSQSRK